MRARTTTSAAWARARSAGSLFGSSVVLELEPDGVGLDRVVELVGAVALVGGQRAASALAAVVGGAARSRRESSGGERADKASERHEDADGGQRNAESRIAQRHPLADGAAPAPANRPRAC